jgi:hypothetical protein
MRTENTSTDDSMKLPEGKTCQDCAHFQWCVKFFGCKPANETCDWAPSRFVPKREDADER